MRSPARAEFGHVERLDQALTAVHDPNVGAVELVGRADQEIAVELPELHRRVRYVVHRVHQRERSGGPGQPHRGRHVIHGTECVGRRADGEESGARGERRFERGPVELPVARSTSTIRSVMPRSRARACQGATFA